MSVSAIPESAERAEFDRVFVELLPRLYRRALLLTGGRPAAEDTLHDTYLKLVARPGRLVEHPYPYGFALATVLNVIRDGWRRRRRELLSGDIWQYAVGRTDSALECWESGQDTIQLLSHLTARQAAAVLLVDIEGFTLDEAAELMGVHRGTIARSRRRALDKLRTLLAARSHPDHGDRRKA